MTALRAFAAMVVLVTLAGCGSEFRREEEVVSRRLRDPASAQFRDERRCGNSEIVEGDVNGKNAFGAMAGFMHFVTDGHDVGFEGDASIYDHGTSRSFIDLEKRCTEATLAAIPAQLRNQAEANVQAAMNDSNTL